MHIDNQRDATENIAGERELHRRKMALFNAFHQVRRFANSIEYDEARKYAITWIGLLDEIDACTTLEQRFELCGTNAAHRPEMIDLAKEYNARLTMHALLSLNKAGHTATYRPRDGCGWDGERFGTHLRHFTMLERKDLDPCREFIDSQAGTKKPAPNALAAQFADLMARRGNLVKLSRDNQECALNTPMPNLAVVYEHIAALHEHVLSIFQEADADGSIGAIESAMAKAEPFCVEATALEHEAVKILKSDAEDAPARVIH